MKLETFFENFELLTDAPNAATKLREIILQLAVQGNLSYPNAEDKPIAVLLEEIEVKRKELSKTKGIKQIKVLPIDKSFEPPFEIPSHWRWIRLGAISQKLGAGSTPLGGKNVYVDSGIKFLRSQNVWNDGLKLEGVAHITPEIHRKMAGTVVEPGDVLLNITGASIGRCAVVPDDFDEANVSQHVSIIRLIDKSIGCYIHLCIISSLIQTRIMEVQVGISREGLSMARLKDFPIPLPPLAEQKRIVEKCDRLLILCDEIEKRQQQRQESLLKMNDGAISQLFTAQNPDECDRHWQRLCNNFDLLYSIPETIPKLRQAILQLAVQGKLVPQRFNDESASVLLGKIKEEKAKLIEESKIRALKPLPAINQDEIPFVLPEGWLWVRMQEIFTVITDGDHQAPPQTTSGIPFLVISNVREGFLNFESTRFVSEEFFLSVDENRKPIEGDILYTVVGSYGIPIVVNTNQPFFVQRHIALLKPSELLEVNYLKHVLNSDLAFDQATRFATGIAQKTVPLSGLRKMIVPLPPLAEQKRIVAKVDSLLSLCDTLEAKLKAARESSATLMEVAAKQVLVA